MRKLKQKTIPWLGAAIDSLYTAMPIMSILNFVSVNAVLYATTKDYLVERLPWITFYHWIGLMVVLTLILMTFMYFAVLPSLWNFRAKQMNITKAIRAELRDFLDTQSKSKDS